MKFTRIQALRQKEEAIGYIDSIGDLHLKDIDGDTVCLTEAFSLIVPGAHFDPEDGVELFYPGDTLTITF